MTPFPNTNLINNQPVSASPLTQFENEGFFVTPPTSTLAENVISKPNEIVENNGQKNTVPILTPNPAPPLPPPPTEYEDYENFNVAYHNLLKHLPKTIALISKMKNENMKKKDEVIFLNKVKILLEEACVQCGKISLATNYMNQTMGSPSPTLFYYKRQN